MKPKPKGREECTCPSKAFSKTCPIASHRWYARRAEKRPK